MKPAPAPVALFLCSVCLASYMVKQVAEVESGADALSQVVCGDTDSDGMGEFAFRRGTLGRRMWRWETWEYQPRDGYELVKAETCIGDPYPPPGMSKGTFFPCDVGDADDDGLADILGVNDEWFYTDSFDSVRAYLCLYESPRPGAYPDSLVWRFHYGTNVVTSQNAWFPGDLDGDGRKEMLFTDGGWTYIFENRGDNQYELVYKSPLYYCGYDYAFGDFDLDGRQEFVYSPVGRSYVYVFECTGDDQYVLTDSIFHYYPNGSDVFSGNDLDQDGKPEFFIVYVRVSQPCVFYVVMYEATGDDSYEATVVDSLYGANYSQARHSVCADIDLDGVEELLVSFNSGINIYRATGNNAFEVVYVWHNPMPNGEAHIRCRDMNGNGYPDIVISGNAHTWLLEMEAVRVLAPNGGEELVPNETCFIRWQTFNPPRCDSVSLFLNRGWKHPLDTIITGLAPDDTVYPWVVRPGPLDSCHIFAVAYGPGWQYDESDSGFRITPGGIGEDTRQEFEFSKPAPTVVRGVLRLRDCHPVSAGETGGYTQAVLLDVSGRKVMDLVPGENDVRHLASGVYLVITPHPKPLPQGEREKNPSPATGRERMVVRKVVLQK